MRCKASSEARGRVLPQRVPLQVLLLLLFTLEAVEAETPAEGDQAQAAGRRKAVLRSSHAIPRQLAGPAGQATEPLAGLGRSQLGGLAGQGSGPMAAGLPQAPPPGGPAPLDLSGISLGGLGSAEGLNDGIEQSQQTTELASGIVESFLHKQELKKGELDCLTEGTGEAAGEVRMMANKVSKLLKQVLNKGSTFAKEMSAPPGRGGLGGGLGAGLPSLGAAGGENHKMDFGALGGMPGLGSLPGMPPMPMSAGSQEMPPGLPKTPSGVPQMPLIMPGMPKLPGMDKLLKDSGMAGTALSLPNSSTATRSKDAMQQHRRELLKKQEEAEERKKDEAQKDKAETSLKFFYQSRRLEDGKLPRRLQVMAPPMMGLGGGPHDGDMMMGTANVMQFGVSLERLVDLVHDMTSKCVKGDALAALKQASRHFRNTSYVEGRIVANGADVMEYLSAALSDYENKRFKDFGRDVGGLMRKILLSNSTDGSLPEGLPDKKEMANLTTGLLTGFFGSGFILTIEGQGDTPVEIDLHHCISSNLNFFQSIWAATLYAFAKKESEAGEKSKAEFATVVALTMMQVPKAMKRCGIGKEQEEALMDSIKVMGEGTQTHLATPKVGHLGHGKVSSELASTVDAYTRTDWYNFGEDLGRILRQFALQSVQEKYRVDTNGQLRLRLHKVGQEPRPTLVNLPLVVASMAVSGSLLFFAALVIRTRRRACTLARAASERRLRRELAPGQAGFNLGLKAACGAGADIGPVE